MRQLLVDTGPRSFRLHHGDGYRVSPKTRSARSIVENDGLLREETGGTIACAKHFPGSFRLGACSRGGDRGQFELFFEN